MGGNRAPGSPRAGRGPGPGERTPGSCQHATPWSTSGCSSRRAVSVPFCCARHPDVTGPAEARPRGAGQAVPGPVPRACPGPDGRSVCTRRPVSRWITITMVVNGVALSSCVLLLAYHSVYSGLLARPTGLPTRCRPHGPPPRPRLCRLSRLGHTELSC